MADSAKATADMSWARVLAARAIYAKAWEEGVRCGSGRRYDAIERRQLAMDAEQCAKEEYPLDDPFAPEE